MKKFIAAAILAVCAIGGPAWAAETDTQPTHNREHRGKEFIATLHLTDAQKKDLSALKMATEKKAIELRAQAETAKLELRHALMSDTPDQSVIEKKMSELVKCESDLRMNKVDGWFAINKALTPEQQKIWVKALRAGTLRAMAEGRGGMNRSMRHPGRPGRHMAPRPEMQ